MNKQELIEKISEDTGLSKKDAERALNSFIDNIKKSLKKGEKVSLVGFGTFDVSKRKAREGRNPQTGETIKIEASKAPKFKAGKAFKEELN
ncbi:MAG: HU family DNA-binding protein [Lachnospiraceae bacterium]|nr:HU family DNA-binding protein [Lachnospiraceae bacterium]